MVLPLLAGRRFQVLFHSPHRGAFHLSLTVLVHYRLPGSIQPCETVLTDSRRVSRVPRYSGFRSGKTETFSLRDCHPLRCAVPDASVTLLFCNFPTVPENCPIGSRNPAYATLSGLSHIYGLGFFRFARRYFGNHFCFLLLGLLRCFSSPRSPGHPMYSHDRVPALPGTGSPIRKSPDQSLFGGSPELIAACRVLHRLLTPRHPPSALQNLTAKYGRHIISDAFIFFYVSELSKISPADFPRSWWR